MLILNGPSIPTLNHFAIRDNETVILIGASAFAPSVKRLGGPALECLFTPSARGQSQASIGALPHAPISPAMVQSLKSCFGIGKKWIGIQGSSSPQHENGTCFQILFLRKCPGGSDNFSRLNDLQDRLAFGPGTAVFRYVLRNFGPSLVDVG